ncbi:MAG: ATP-binding protein [Rhodospirillaceae bacterium]|nr:ATP-binding protein [Rhodospirillaceae bacterium]
MSLRLQLLGLGLLTLVLPWAGYRYVQELEGALRSGLAQSLLATAESTAAALPGQDLRTIASGGAVQPGEVMYAHPLTSEPLIDGYRDDWTSAESTGLPLGGSGRFWIGVYQRSLFLFLHYPDANVVYQRAPGETPYGDRVLLLTESAQPDWLLFHTTAPGSLRAQETTAPLFTPTGRRDARVPAFWRETGDGFTAEIRLPLAMAGQRIGIAVVDVDPGGSDTATATYQVAVESSWPGDHPGMLLYRPAGLAMSAAQFIQSGRRLVVVGPAGWILFDEGDIDPLSASFDDLNPGLMEQIYRFILRGDDPAFTGFEQPPGRLGRGPLKSILEGSAVTAWFARGGDASAVVTAGAPIMRGDEQLGAVILEQGSDSILTLTNAALVRLLSVTFLAMLIVAAGLLSYATVLSFRVRRLSRAAETALGPKGEIRASLPGRRASDEIGDLARSFSDLLNRLRDYTAYLTTLKAKLTHELRTPLAVASTSLENLEREPHGANLSPYLSRLKEGISRLDGILSAMTEATLIEQSVAATEPEAFDLDTVLASCTAAYRDIYPHHTIEYHCEATHTGALGSGELIVQMMDKLIDNAVSFSLEDTPIQVTLDGTHRELTIRVVNRGPRLPSSMRSQLFDSLVSIRRERDGRHHLGLGLHIVSLVADFHRGTVRGEDLPDGSGVVFTVTMPVEEIPPAAPGRLDVPSTP